VVADGNEIENCACLRAPDTRGLVARWFSPEHRPRIGVTVDPRQAPEDDALGARVTDLLEDGPADEAGLREGDVVVRFDGHDLRSALEVEKEEDFDLDQSLPVQRLLTLARAMEPGDEVEVEYLRDGERRSTTLEARELERWGARAWSFSEPGDLRRHFEGAFPDGGALEFRIPDKGRGELHAPEARRFRMHVPEGGRFDVLPGKGLRGEMLVGDDGRFSVCPDEEAGGDRAHVLVFGDTCLGGMRLVALNAAVGEYFGTERGVLVADVHPESPLGLEPGDVIQRIGARDTDSPERVRAILRSYEPEEPVTLHILRDGRAMDVQGRLSR